MDKNLTADATAVTTEKSSEERLIARKTGNNRGAKERPLPPWNHSRDPRLGKAEGRDPSREGRGRCGWCYPAAGNDLKKRMTGRDKIIVSLNAMTDEDRDLLRGNIEPRSWIMTIDTSI